MCFHGFGWRPNMRPQSVIQRMLGYEFFALIRHNIFQDTRKKHFHSLQRWPITKMQHFSQRKYNRFSNLKTLRFFYNFNEIPLANLLMNTLAPTHFPLVNGHQQWPAIFSLNSGGISICLTKGWGKGKGCFYALFICTSLCIYTSNVTKTGWKL